MPLRATKYHGGISWGLASTESLPPGAFVYRLGGDRPDETSDFSMVSGGTQSGWARDRNLPDRGSQEMVETAPAPRLLQAEIGKSVAPFYVGENMDNGKEC